MKSLTLISLLVLATACGQWNQDPMAGISGAVKQGLEKPTTPEAPKPIDSEALRINSPDDYSFEQQVAGEFEISSRILIPDYQDRLVIKNIDQFAGASFDSKTGKFRWTPPQGTISEGDGLIKRMSLEVVAYAEKKDAISLQRQKTIKISVTRKPSAPQIISFSLTKTNLREGEFVSGTVVYEDKDANEKDSSTWPVLQFRTSIGSAHIMSFLEMGSTGSLGNRRFQTAFTLNLREAEVTKTIDNYSIVVRAVSSLNQSSADASVSLTVYSSFADANSTWTQSVPFTAGKIETYDFLIMDPKAEAKLDSAMFMNMPPGARANCTNVNASVLSCRLIWDIPVNAKTGPGQINLNIAVKANTPLDNYSRAQSFKLDYSVAPAPVSTTTTTTTVSTTTTVTTTTLIKGVR